MPGPWEDYAPTATQTVGGPWEDYGKKPWEDYAPKKKTLEQIKASVGPSSESEVPLATKVGSALYSPVEALSSQNWLNAIKSAGHAVGTVAAGAMNLPTRLLNAVTPQLPGRFRIEQGSEAPLTQGPPEAAYALPYKAGQSAFKPPLPNAEDNPLSQVVNDLAAGATTPESLALLPLTASKAAIQIPTTALKVGLDKLVQAWFASQVAPGIAEGAQAVLDPNTTPREKLVGGLEGLVAGGVLHGIGKGLAPADLPKGGPIPDVSYSMPRIEDLSTQEQPASAVSALLPQFSGGPYPAENTKLVNAGGGVMDLTQLSPVERAALDQRTRQVYRLRGEEVGPRPAQAETPIIGQQPQQNIIRQVQLEQGGEVGPVSQATRAPVEPSGGEVSFRAPAAAEAIPNAQQVALPNTPKLYAGEAMIFDPEFWRQTAAGVKDIAKWSGEMLAKHGPQIADSLKQGIRLAQRDDQTEWARLMQVSGDSYDQSVAEKWNRLPDKLKDQVNEFNDYAARTEAKFGRFEYGKGSGTFSGADQAKAAIARKENKLGKQIDQLIPGFSSTATIFAKGEGRFEKYKEQNASRIRSNQENLSQEGLQPKGSGEPFSPNLQLDEAKGNTPSDTLQRQAPIEQRGPLGGNVSTFGLLDPAVYKQAGEDIVGVIKKLNNDRAAVADSLKRIGTKAIIVAKHEAVDTGRYQAEHLAEQSFRLEAGRLFQQFGDTAQKAVLVYKSAKGDKTLLPKFLAQATKGGDKELARLVRFAGTNWDQIRRLSDKAEAMDKINLANAKQAGIDISTVGDYVKRIVENPNEGLIFKQRGIGGTGKSSKLARVYPTIFDGAEAGLRYNLDTAAAIGKRTGEIQMQINMKNWVEGNRSLVDPVEKQPVIKDLIKDKSGVMTAPRGYVEVQISKGNNVAVLQGYERVVKALQSEGLTGLGWQAALYGTGAIKHGSFAFDFYHQFKIIRARKSFGLSNPLTNPLGYKHGLALIDFEASDLAEAVKQKKAIGDATSYANEQLTFKRTGAKDLTYTRREIAKLFQDGGLRIGQHSEAIYSSLVRSLPLLKQTAGRSNRFIFDKLSRGAMEEAAQIEFERLMNASPDKPVAEIVQAIKTDLNFKFGNMGKQGIWKNKTMQDLSQLVFSAPSWTESLAQSEVRSVYQLGKAAIPGSGSFGTRGSLGRSNMNLTLFWVAATQILSLALNNKPTWENDNPEHKFDAYIPPLTKDGKGFYVSPLSDHMEILHDYIRYSNKDEENPTAKILSNKLSGPARFTHTMLTGDTWNNHLETIAERLNSAWPDLLPVPLPARMAYDAYKTKDLTPLERQGFSMLGVKAEPETRTEQIQKVSVDKPLEQRQAEATKRKDEQEPRTRQETVQSANYAVKAVAKRAEEMQARLPKEQQRWLTDNKLVLPGHENKVHTDAADVVMTEKENKAFEALLLTGYKEMIKSLQGDPEFKKLATHSERVHVFGHYMSAARANAAGEIIGQMDAVKAKK